MPNPFDKDPADAIPMKKMKPATLAIGAAVVVIIGGLIAFGAGHKKTHKVDEAKIQAEEAKAAQQKEKAKEIREHLAITQRAMAAVKQEDKGQGSDQKEQAQVAPAPAPAAHHAAVHHAVSKRAAKKQMNTLDNLGKSITSELGK